MPLTLDGLPKYLTNPDPSIYLNGSWVALDFETTNHNKGTALDPTNKIVFAHWRTSEGGVNSRFAGEFQLNDLVQDINNADFLIAHNAKFELHWLKRCGLDLHNVLVYDTMLAEYVIGGNRWQFGELALDAVAKRRWNKGKDSLVSKMIKAGVNPETLPRSWVAKYCERDVELTVELAQAQLQAFRSESPRLLPIVYSRCLLTPVLADIEANGMMLDKAAVQAEYNTASVALAELTKELDAITGGINFNSPKQLAQYMYDTLGIPELSKYGKPRRTPAGGRLTDAPTILSLRPSTAAQRKFLDLYRQAKAVGHDVGFYLKKFVECCKGSDKGVLYASFNQSNTRTHRLSSSGLRYKVQLHNLQRRYKPLFKSRKEGWLIGEADEAQLEFRAAVHLGRDKAGLDDILNRVDVHTSTADIIKCDRQTAKSHTFKPLYGGRKGTKAEMEYYEYFRKRYSGITDTQNSWINAVLRDGKLETEYGLVFYWPGTRMDSSGYINNTTSICNYPVQGFATGEIVPLAVVWLWHRIHAMGYQMYLINSIHDSIIVELPESELEAFHELAQQCLVLDVYNAVKAIYGISLTIPLGCGVMSGTHWGAKNETKYELDMKTMEVIKVN
jgi:DNA polymerase I-like protein with 3'-5' exonuclease and polymerase domains